MATTSLDTSYEEHDYSDATVYRSGVPLMKHLALLAIACPVHSPSKDSVLSPVPWNTMMSRAVDVTVSFTGRFPYTLCTCDLLTVITGYNERAQHGRESRKGLKQGAFNLDYHQRGNDLNLEGNVTLALEVRKGRWEVQ